MQAGPIIQAGNILQIGSVSRAGHIIQVLFYYIFVIITPPLLEVICELGGREHEGAKDLWRM